jgi:adenylate kinase
MAWLISGDARCTTDRPLPERPYRMVLLGAPGVGKGTQADYLCQTLGTCHLSTGDVFRTAKCYEGSLSPAMSEALGAMMRGELVSDDTVIDMIRERLGCLKCDYGFLLDGFPRTVHQAEALEQILADNHLQLDAVLDYELPIDEVVARLSGRRTCRECKCTFHVVHKPSRQEGVCDLCGGELYQREDDQPESIRVRLQAYQESTAPLTAFYRERGLLMTISAVGEPGEVFQRTVTALS